MARSIRMFRMFAIALLTSFAMVAVTVPALAMQTEPNVEPATPVASLETPTVEPEHPPVTPEVSEAGLPPVANPDAFTVQEGETRTYLDVVSNDTDPDADMLQLVSCGSLSNSIGTIERYTQSGCVLDLLTGYSGEATASYVVSDGTNESIGSINLTIEPAAVAPIARFDWYTFTQGTTGLVLEVLANDTDADGDVLHLVSCEPIHPSSGTLQRLNDSACLLDLAPDFIGEFGTTYVVSDGVFEISGGISVKVESATPTPTETPAANNPPSVPVVSFSLEYGEQGFTFDVLDVVSDPDGDEIQLVSCGPIDAAIGTLERFSDHECVLNVAEEFVGFARGDFLVTDGTYQVSGSVLFSVEVPASTPPTARDDFWVFPTSGSPVANTVLSNDSSWANGSLHVHSYTDPQHGLLVCTPAPPDVGCDDLVYTPEPGFIGTDTFTYDVIDTNGNVSNTATVTIRMFVPDQNRVPVANPENVRVHGGGVSDFFDPLANDYDLDGDKLSLVPSTALTMYGGIVFCLPNFTRCIYYNPRYFGVDAFVYSVTDGIGTSAESVILFVPGDNIATDVVDDTYMVAPGETLDAAEPGVLGNDVDPEGDVKFSVVTVPPAHGTVTLNLNGSFSYQPEPGFSGFDSFTYGVIDIPASVLAIGDPFDPKIEPDDQAVVTIFVGVPPPSPTATSVPTEIVTVFPTTTPEPTEPPLQTPTGEPTGEASPQVTVEPATTPTPQTTAVAGVSDDIPPAGSTVGKLPVTGASPPNSRDSLPFGLLLAAVAFSIFGLAVKQRRAHIR